MNFSVTGVESAQRSSYGASQFTGSNRSVSGSSDSTVNIENTLEPEQCAISREELNDLYMISDSLIHSWPEFRKLELTLGNFFRKGRRNSKGSCITISQKS